MALQHVTDFKNKYTQAAINAAQGTPIFFETIIAAAALESNWGRSVLSSQHNNFFGIKAGSSWKGQVAKMPTREQDKKGNVFTVYAPFRKYDNAEDCFKNYVAVITQPRYVAAGVTKATTPAEQFKALKAGGYATDIAYPQKLLSVLKTLGIKVTDAIQNNPGASTLTTLAIFFLIYAVAKQ